MPLWAYDTRSNRYRVTSEGAQALGRKAGTYISDKTLVEVRDRWIDVAKQRTDSLAGQYARGQISLDQWREGMRQEIRINHINEYMLGHGGRNSMTQADWGRVGQRVQVQYRYLDGFANDIASGNLTDAQIAARARMYVEASSASFEQGNVRARGGPDLPAMPGDGSTQCLTNCKCHWTLKETANEWRCYWVTTPAEHCDDCIERARTWNPLVLPKG